MKEKIKSLSEKYFAKVQEIFHHLHKYPEISGKEFETANYICSVLDSIDIEYQRDIAGCGVVALLHGRGHGKVVALRADMDALPITELTNLPYSSVNKGVMHACGHDVHCASLLGSLMILNELKNEFSGTVKAIFQPSEEEYDGGAIFMINEGILQNPNVDIIIGQHVTPGMEVGCVGFCEGVFMASTDEIHINVKGTGGHAARPQETNNPIYPAMSIIKQSLKFVETRKPQNIPTILAYGKFIADGSTNIIPPEVSIAGTFRTFDEKWREIVVKEIQKITQIVETEFNVECECNIRRGYPVLVNDIETTRRAKSCAKQFIVNQNVINLPLRTTAEDFAYYLQHCKGVFYRLGVSNFKKNITGTTHSSLFQIDEDALKIGCGLMSFIAINELMNK